jgi:hypothetical protein
VCYSLEDQLPRYRTDAAVASAPMSAPALAGKPTPIIARHGV